jgi:rare lipoprotein A
MGRGAKRVVFRRVAQVGALTLGCMALASCSANKFGKLDPKYGVSSSPRVVADGEPVPKGGGNYRVGKPYMVGGRTYVPEEDIHYRAEGTASWYGDDFHGRLTANGEVFDMHSISAAHPTLPMPSYVRVTNLANRRSLVVRVNDRGPYAGNRVIDLSVKAAQLLNFHQNGLAKVRVEYVGRAPLEGSDDRQLMATLREDGPAPAPSAVRVASARPFLPEAPDPVQPATSAPQAVPMPPERPYLLGQGQSPIQRMELPRGPEMAAVARPLGQPLTAKPLLNPNPLAKPLAQPAVRVEASALSPAREPRSSLAPASGTLGTLSSSGASPVSAYAPTGYNAPAAFVSGRGLY